jgi:hypothetical protein
MFLRGLAASLTGTAVPPTARLNSRSFPVSFFVFMPRAFHCPSICIRFCCTRERPSSPSRPVRNACRARCMRPLCAACSVIFNHCAVSSVLGPHSCCPWRAHNSQSHNAIPLQIMPRSWPSLTFTGSSSPLSTAVGYLVAVCSFTSLQTMAADSAARASSACCRTTRSTPCLRDHCKSCTRCMVG